MQEPRLSVKDFTTAAEWGRWPIHRLRDRPTPGVTATPGPAPLGTSFCDVQLAIYNPYCTSCHAGTYPAGNLSLAQGKAYAATVNVASSAVPSLKRVLPSDPQNSYLFRKVNGTHTQVGGYGAQMPQGAAALSAELQALLEQWILEGASEVCDVTPPPTPTPTPPPPPTPTPDKGELRVEGSVSQSSAGTYAASVSVISGRLSSDGKSCQGSLLGSAAVSGGSFRFDERDLSGLSAYVCVRSDGGGVAEQKVSY